MPKAITVGPARLRPGSDPACVAPRSSLPDDMLSEEEVIAIAERWVTRCGGAAALIILITFLIRAAAGPI